MSSALSLALDAAPTEPALFYLRFFLHSVPEPVQSIVRETIARHARTGDYFAAEFRTDKDAENNKVHGRHYRRFQNGPDFGLTLREYGFTVLDEQEGAGLSLYQGEDPELYRVIACKD